MIKPCPPCSQRPWPVTFITLKPQFTQYITYFGFLCPAKSYWCFSAPVLAITRREGEVIGLLLPLLTLLYFMHKLSGMYMWSLLGQSEGAGMLWNNWEPIQERAEPTWKRLLQPPPDTENTELVTFSSVPSVHHGATEGHGSHPNGKQNSLTYFNSFPSMLWERC